VDEHAWDDPVADILSAAVRRRHIPKSIQALAVARAYPEPTKLRRTVTPIQRMIINGPDNGSNSHHDSLQTASIRRNVTGRVSGGK
jgi:hypothetical protein